MSSLLETLARNLDEVLQRVAEACRVVGRSPGSVQLIAVTKYAKIEWIDGLISLGLNQFGENRPQQLAERQARWPQVEWHLIGHLQRNKAKSVLGTTELIHSVDSLRLAECLSELGANSSPAGQIPILCEVNVSGEASKDGFPVDELLARWDQLIALTNLNVRGFMTMAPLSADPEAARPVFAKLRQLRDEFCERSGDSLAFTELSMGMSGDFEIAIQEGATLIRVGSRLFEGLG